MDSFLYLHEQQVRLLSFLLCFLLLAFWEWRAPRRPLTVSKPLRWVNNLALMIINTLVLRFALPVLAVGFAVHVQQQQWGMFNAITWPFWLEVVLAVLLLDLAIYWQHRLMHVVPLLWRLHRMHHSDRDLDVTSAIRFHPIEMVLSMAYKLGLIALLGPAVTAVIVFEIVLNTFSLFNHTNGYLPEKWDRRLRWFLVTPDMHRIHHSKYFVNETNSNYGVLTSLWDRLFGSYTEQPKEGQQKLSLGVEGFSSLGRAQYLSGLLMTPFLSRKKLPK